MQSDPLPTATPGKPLLISFSGIDGAGKSTQILRLYESLEHAGLSVKLITFWDDVVQLKSFREQAAHKVFKGDKGVGSPEAPISRRDKNVQSPILTAIRMTLYFLDTLALRQTVREVSSLGSQARPDVVIFDRYIYDELANINFGHPLSGIYLRLLLLFIPKPDIALVLDANPDEAFVRKPEYPLEFLRSNRNAYLELSRRIAGITVIPPMPIETAHDLIVKQTMKRYAPPPMGGVKGHILQEK
jgi:thymidylate kinase